MGEELKPSSKELGINKETTKSRKLTREEVIKRLENKENLEDLVLVDLDLAGLNLEGKSFRRSDIRGLSLYRKDKDKEGQIIELKTNIQGADFTDATVADLGPEVFFGRVEAKGATFGFTENLVSRRTRLKESGQTPTAENCGGFFGFNGSEGNFNNTQWANIDFGGGSGYEAIFPGTDLTAATIQGSDLAGIDFSQTKIDHIKIIDPVSLLEMKINTSQIETIANGVQLSNQDQQAEFSQIKTKEGSRKALESYFHLTIVETQD